MTAGVRVPVWSARSVLFNVINAVTFTTESRGRPEAFVGRNTLPGIVANWVFEVTAATNTVANRLRLYEFPEITNTGRRFAGREPTGSPRSAQ